MSNCPMNVLKCRINIKQYFGKWMSADCSACGKRWLVVPKGKIEEWLPASYQAKFSTPATPEEPR